VHWRFPGAAVGVSGAGPRYPFRRMSSGVGLRPPPPPLFRLQGHRGPAPDPPTAFQKTWRPPAHRKPSPVAAGRLLGKIKEEAARRPGDICARGLPAATGPSRSRPHRSETPAAAPVHPATRVPSCSLCDGHCNKTLPSDGRRTFLRSHPWGGSTGWRTLNACRRARLQALKLQGASPLSVPLPASLRCAAVTTACITKDSSRTPDFVSHRSFLAVFMLSSESKNFEKSLDSRPPRRDVVSHVARKGACFS
jgi:hypothetical protein